MWLGVQVWAYANLGYDPGALIDAVAQTSEHRMREFSPQNVSNILWAYAKLCKCRICVFVQPAGLDPLHALSHD